MRFGLPSSDQGILCAKDSEPVFFHEKPPSVPQQLISDYFIRGIVDFTPGSGVWAYQAIRKNLPYVGVTCSDDHCNGVQRWLLKCLQRGIEDASDQALYRADLVAEPDEPNPKKPRKDPAASSSGNRRGKRGQNNAELLRQLQGMYGGGNDGGDEDDGEPTE